MTIDRPIRRRENADVRSPAGRLAAARGRDLSLAGGPEHFSQAASLLGAPPVQSGSSDDLHIQSMLLRPGGWTHPGSEYVRFTVPLAQPGRVRRRLVGEDRSWLEGLMRMGTFSLTPPHCEGTWEWRDVSHFGLIFLPEALLHRAHDEIGPTSRPVSLRPVFAEPDPIVGPLFRSIVEQIGHEGRQTRLFLSSAALFLTRYVVSRYGPAAGDVVPQARILDDGRLRRVINSVESNPSHDWSVDEMARLAGLSLFRFAHAFKERVGVSPRRFVQGRRLARASRLLTVSTFSIAEIAAQCGFENQSWFTTCFRREFGTTPAVYRRRSK